MRIAAAALFVLMATGTASARTWLIRPDGSGDAPTIQAGVDSAQAGDEVLLAAGTYTSASQGSIGPTMVELKPGLTLRGEAGAAATFIVSTTRAIRLVETGNATRIEGLTIEGRTDLMSPESDGGGLYVLGNGAPTIVDCVFQNCRVSGGNPERGGAIACEPAVEPTILGCAFRGCRSSLGVGGAISCNVATIQNCEFSNNSSYYSGGAIVCGAATIEACEFRGNGSGGDPGGTGGAIVSSGASISNCIFEGNYSGGPFAGAAGAVSGAIYVADCVFTNNSTSSGPGAHGGAVRLADGGSVLRCTFAGNNAQFGGALSMASGQVTECLFVGNAASGGFADAASGGAIRASGGAVIESCTFLANRCTPATNPGAISAPATATIRRCIIAYTVGTVCETASMATWSCCDLFDNSAGNAICGIDGGGNFSADPQFCSADPVASLNVTLQADSPCAPGNHPIGDSCDLIGVGAVGCGTVGVQRAHWGDVKRLYR